MWAARNCRFLPLSLRKYIEQLPNCPAEVRDVEVLVGSEWKKLLELSSWELLNINNDDVMSLRDQVFKLVYPEKDYPEDE